MESCGSPISGSVNRVDFESLFLSSLAGEICDGGIGRVPLEVTL